MRPPLLRRERERRGWSQERLAGLLGVSARTILRWEQGSTVPYPYYREQLANLFHMSVSELGLLLTPEKNDALPVTSPATFTISHTTSPVLFTKSPSFLADPLIPKTLGHP